jgi:hypothetical protein
MREVIAGHEYSILIFYHLRHSGPLRCSLVEHAMPSNIAFSLRLATPTSNYTPVFSTRTKEAREATPCSKYSPYFHNTHGRTHYKSLASTGYHFTALTIAVPQPEIQFPPLNITITTCYHSYTYRRVSRHYHYWPIDE